MIRHAPSIGLGIGLSLRGSGARFSGILDQYAGAAAAYSLRALTSNWLAGDVVEVRRSSDSTTQGFTASQIDSGAMLDFVKKPGAFTNSGFETFANNGTGDGFTATNTASDGQASSPTVSGGTSDVVTIEFDLTIVSGSPALSLRLSGGPPVSNLEAYTTSGSKTAVLTATGAFDGFTFSEGDVPSEFTVSNVRVSTNDGFVSTWYDQSGNGNDATQATTTAQPKIVDAGALVTGGLDFDGVDDSMGTGALSLSAQPISRFAVGSFDSISEASYFVDGSADNRGVIGASAVATWRIFAGGTADDYATAISLSTDYLTSGIFSGASTNLQVNGSNLGNKNVGTDGLDKVQIGSGNVGGGAFYLDGKVAEIIVYNSDQSANRVGIETNINDHYSIY